MFFLLRAAALLALGGCAAPVPAASPADACSTGQIVDDGTCVPTACGVGKWGGERGDVYVDAAAGEGGDGSEDLPVRTIQAGADLGGRVIVAAGVYVENVSLVHKHNGVSLVGRCQDLVTIDASGAELPGVSVAKNGTNVAMSGITVIGGYPGLSVNGATVTVEASGFGDSRLFGINAYLSATVTLRDVWVSGTTPIRGVAGRGINAQEHAALTAADCTIRGNTEIGVFAASSGTTVSLTNCVILDTLPLPDGTAGNGILVQDAATLTAAACTVEGNTGVGVLAFDAGSSIDLVDTHIVDTRVAPDGTGGHGIEVQTGAAIRLTDCTVRGSTEHGAIVKGAGSILDLLDSSILDTAPTSRGTRGEGINVANGAEVRASGCLLQGNTGAGVFASDPDTVVALDDTEISETRPYPDGTGGIGVGIGDGATLTATRCVVRGNTEVGVQAVNAGTTAHLLDTIVVDTRASVQRGGSGLVGADGAEVTATRCTLERSTGVGVLASEIGTTVELVDTLIIGTRTDAVTAFAIGVNAQAGASVTMQNCTVSGTEGPAVYVPSGRAELDRVVMTKNRFAGVVVLNGSVSLANSTILDTGPDAEWGGGLGVYTNALFGPPTLTLTNSTIGPHRYAAIWLDGEGTYDIEGNTLSGSAGILLPSRPAHGNALFAENGVRAWDGTTGLLLARNTFTDASLIAVLLHDASATLDANTWDKNTLDLRQQHCGENGEILLAADLSGVPTWVQSCPDGADTLIDLSMEFTSLYLPEVAPAE